MRLWSLTKRYANDFATAMPKFVAPALATGAKKKWNTEHVASSEDNK